MYVTIFEMSFPSVITLSFCTWTGPLIYSNQHHFTSTKNIVPGFVTVLFHFLIMSNKPSIKH